MKPSTVLGLFRKKSVLRFREFSFTISRFSFCSSHPLLSRRFKGNPQKTKKNDNENTKARMYLLSSHHHTLESPSSPVLGHVRKKTGKRSEQETANQTREKKEPNPQNSLGTVWEACFTYKIKRKKDLEESCSVSTPPSCSRWNLTDLPF